ncbi:MAG TPA: hypothetical protein VHR18_06035 [Solirubrobacterales bacterium]|jgi:hypothetical protein|nr:hypothetical protein [Solirubrobacterales bacterium]
MRNALKRRPSPAMIVGVLALVMAMAGTSVAALNGPLNGNQIKKQSIGAGKLKKKTLTGFQINTNKLGTVPKAQSAAQADSLSPGGSAPLQTRWLLLNEAGQIEEQSGGFTVIDAYGTNANVYINSGSSLAGHGLTATIAIQNKVDLGAGEAGPDPNFQGEVSVARCQTVAVECAPPGAKTPNALVVSPRNSDGSATAGTAMNPRKRVYVEVTE